MALKIHLEVKGDGKTAVMACGETAHRVTGRYHYGDGEWESTRRIGGLVSAKDNKFFPDPRTHCAKCIAHWMKEKD